MSVFDTSISDYNPIVNKKRFTIEGIPKNKDPKTSITQLIQRKQMTKDESKRSLYSNERTRSIPPRYGKYQNNTLNKILSKRKNEINDSFSIPNNVIDENYIENVIIQNRTQKIESKLYKKNNIQ